MRLTGGEPLLRAQVAELTAQIAGLGVLDDLAMTTNGVLLAPAGRGACARPACAASPSVSTRCSAIASRRSTRRDHLVDVLAGIDAATETFGAVKIDTVLMGGVNDDEVEALVAFAGTRNAEIRFIEYMDVPGATHWTASKVVSRDAILRRVEDAFGAVETLPPDGPAPASRYRLASGQVFGVIASTTTPFCATCDRIRLTADGHLFLCLYATSGLDIRTPLRDGASDDELATLIASAWQQRTDRGAEARLDDARTVPPSSRSTTCAAHLTSRCTRAEDSHRNTGAQESGTQRRSASPGDDVFADERAVEAEHARRESLAVGLGPDDRRLLRPSVHRLSVARTGVWRLAASRRDDACAP